MKKFLFMAAVSSMMFTACSNNEDFAEITGSESAKTVEFNMDFTVSSGIETRAGRPLYSQEALQRVNDLNLYVFKDGTYDQMIDITAFNNSTSTGTESHTYKFDTQLTNGTYQFLAVGFEEDAAYKALNFSGLSLDEAKLELADDQEAQEVFAGVSETTYTVSDDTKSLTASVTLNRVVAGVLGYFKNIPYKVENNGAMARVMKVCVELSDKGTAANLDDNTNNTSLGSTYKMLTIDLTNESKAEDGNYYQKAAKAEGEYTTAANSFLEGGYVLPFNKKSGTSTFKVVLYGDGETALKTYKVQVKGSKDTEIDVLANHFYSMGHKSTDKGEPTGPTDPDEPIDLSKDQVITITVDANWEAIHDLELGAEE